MKPEDFEKLKVYLENELKIDPTSYEQMKKKLGQVPNLMQTVLTVYIEQKDFLRESESRLKEMLGELYHKYKYPTRNDGLDFQYSLDNKNEIMIYVEGNKDYIKSSLAIEKLKIQVEFLEKTLTNIKDMQWSLKNIIDQYKFFEGD